MPTNKKNLRAFGRYDGSGRLIPSSVVLRKSKPKVGTWIELPTYQCCDPLTICSTTTTTSTSTSTTTSTSTSTSTSTTSTTTTAAP